MRKFMSILFAAVLFAVCGPFARADTITTFDVSGAALAQAGQSCGSSCAFSGTLTVDVTSGAATAVDITFPGLDPFSTLIASAGAPTAAEWQILATNGVLKDHLILDFTTTHTPASLVGFNGGSISGCCVETTSVPLHDLYLVEGGSITAPATVPEPGSLLLMLVGLGALGFFGAARRIPFCNQ